MSKERLEGIKKRLSAPFLKLGRMSGKTQLFNDLQWLIEQAERVQELEKFKRDVEQMYRYIHLNSKKSVREKEALQEQNKRYREAREIIEQVYKENYVRNANTYGYEDGYLDGLDTAIGIIDKALEDEE